MARNNASGPPVWHRRVGLGAAALVVVVAVSGIALNHADGLGLNDRRLHAAWLDRWYGLSPNGQPIAFRTGGTWVSWWDGALFVGKSAAELRHPDPPVGAVATGRFLAVAFADTMLLANQAGLTIERLSGAALPGTLRRIGRSEAGGVAVETPDGRFLAEGEFLGWRRFAGTASWAEPEPPPEEVADAVRAAYRGPGIAWSRLLLDLHSGRILGSWGPLVVDAAALALLVLAGTGIWSRLRHLR